MLGDEKSRGLRLDRLELAANAGRGIGLGVERIEVRRPAELEEHDDALRGRLARLRRFLGAENIRQRQPGETDGADAQQSPA